MVLFLKTKKNSYKIILRVFMKSVTVFVADFFYILDF